MKVLKFGAGWCQPCKLLDKSLERALKDFPGIEIIPVDIDGHAALVAEHNVKSVPTLVSETGRRLQGNVSESVLRSWFSEL